MLFLESFLSSSSKFGLFFTNAFPPRWVTTLPSTFPIPLAHTCGIFSLVVSSPCTWISPPGAAVGPVSSASFSAHPLFCRSPPVLHSHHPPLGSDFLASALPFYTTFTLLPVVLHTIPTYSPSFQKVCTTNAPIAQHHPHSDSSRLRAVSRNTHSQPAH